MCNMNGIIPLNTNLSILRPRSTRIYVSVNFYDYKGPLLRLCFAKQTFHIYIHNILNSVTVTYLSLFFYLFYDLSLDFVVGRFFGFFVCLFLWLIKVYLMHQSLNFNMNVTTIFALNMEKNEIISIVL